MGRGRARLCHANQGRPQQQLADRAAGNNGMENAFDAADQRGLPGRDRPLLRERTQAVTLLPASSLAEYLDDVAEPLRPFEPVGLQARLHPVRIAGMDATDYLVMLRYREVQILDDRAGVQPPIALGLRLNGLVQRGQARSRPILDDQAVEGPGIPATL